MSRNGKSDKEIFFKNFYPPANWDKLYDSKEYSIYYQLLVKQLGQHQADIIWANRNWDNERSAEDLYQLVKDYKPRDPLCLIGDFNWGYNTIKRALNKRN